ncbi:hypothetical protein MMC27_008780 [Xylographa pallens]|nr:hypothetical protein [Xylographa pallens]
MNTWLSEVYTRHVKHKHSIVIVFVPSLTLEGSDALAVSSNTWKQLIPQISDFNTTVLVFQHGARLEDPFHWEEYLNKSATLLELLFDYHASSEVCKTQASHSVFRFRKLLDVISGVLFVGTPHLNRSDEDAWQRLATVFRVHLKNVTKKTIPKEYLSRLSLSAQRFEGLGLNIPILSGFETQETKLRGGLLASRKAAILVDRNFARTHVEKEDLVGIDIATSSVFDPARATSVFRSHVADYIRLVMETAPDRIANSLREREHPRYSAGIAEPVR